MTLAILWAEPPPPPPPPSVVRLIRSDGNMYLPDRHPPGTKLWYDVWNWGRHDELSMRLYESERERNWYRATYWRKHGKVPVFSGRVAFKHRIGWPRDRRAFA
jgi:hypothetical protein